MIIIIIIISISISIIISISISIIIIITIIIIIRPTDPTLQSRINRKKFACLLICPIPTEKNTSIKLAEKLSKNIKTLTSKLKEFGV